MRYIDGSTLDDARNAYGFGVPLEQIAGNIGVSVIELRNALGLPEVTRPKPIRGHRESGVDLWRSDDLDRVL